MVLTFTEAAAAAVTMGLGCGTTCGTSASAFLSAYILTEARGIKTALKHAGSFLLGKVVAVAAFCMAAAIVGQAVVDEDGLVGGVDLQYFGALMQMVIAVWLIVRWIQERRGCPGCKHCKQTEKGRIVPSFGVGLAYGATPCAPLLLVAGYAVSLSVFGALALGILFAVTSSLIPIVVTAGLSGALSAKIGDQLGKALPWFQLAVYIAFFVIAIVSLL